MLSKTLRKRLCVCFKALEKILSNKNLMRCCRFLLFLRIFGFLRWFFWCLYIFLRFQKYWFLIVNLFWLLRFCSLDDIFRTIPCIRFRQISLYIFWLCIPFWSLFKLMLFHKKLILILICLLIFVRFRLIICRYSHSLYFYFLKLRLQLLMCVWIFKLIELFLRLMVVK